MNDTEFKEILKSLIDDLLIENFLTNLLIIFDINKDHRKEVFYEFISKSNWRIFQPNIHEIGDNQYDYLLLNNSRIRTLDFYVTLKGHFNKKLILDCDSFLNKERLLTLIEGATCSNPDSCEKWPVKLYGKPNFYFRGEIIMLTSHSLSDLVRKKKYFYIWRDCLKI